MADKREDHPSNKGIKGAKKRFFSPDGVVPIFGEELGNKLKKDQLSSALVVAGLGCGVVFGGLAAGVESLIGEYTVYDIPADTLIQHGFDNQNGYYAISSDEGATGYALIQDGEQYRLYSFNRSGEEGGEPQYRLSYISDQDDAWHIIRQNADNFDKAQRSGSDPAVSPPEDNLELYRFGELSGFAQLPDQETIIRDAVGIESSDEDYSSPKAKISAQNAIWQEAAQEVYDGQYGFTEGEIEREAASLNGSSHNDYMVTKVVLSLTSVFVGLGAPFVIGSAASNTRRRRRALKR